MDRLITLLTDFGYKDGYAGIMAGVISGINPAARIVDLSHDIGPGDIRSASFVLAHAYPFFPPGTIHVVVVDPGVGSERKPLLAVTERALFVAPDNGVLSAIFKLEKPLVYEMTNREYWLQNISFTFHGRDIFAPVAAHLSLGVPPEQIGRPLDHYMNTPASEPIVRPKRIMGEVVYCDRFGNLVTNIPSLMTQDARSVRIGTTKINHIVNSFSDVGRHQLLALIGSHGFLEIAKRDGNAALQLHCGVGDLVIVQRQS